ncbi:hypothetical protein L8P27_05160 [Enterobacter asburiae]|uniref:hypothetical protein n=1 Tax=Enterobacter asburiae TaxID=61645 RepID=UPI00200558BC|nr:hypothetical protein [Enterobacter asburiae]MCK7227241.1 hypothetical protein [Enterobacter asburiae]
MKVPAQHSFPASNPSFPPAHDESAIGECRFHLSFPTQKKSYPGLAHVLLSLVPLITAVSVLVARNIQSNDNVAAADDDSPGEDPDEQTDSSPLLSCSHAAAPQVSPQPSLSDDDHDPVTMPASSTVLSDTGDLSATLPQGTQDLTQSSGRHETTLSERKTTPSSPLTAAPLPDDAAADPPHRTIPTGTSHIAPAGKRAVATKLTAAKNEGKTERRPQNVTQRPDIRPPSSTREVASTVKIFSSPASLAQGTASQSPLRLSTADSLTTISTFLCSGVGNESQNPTRFQPWIAKFTRNVGVSAGAKDGLRTSILMPAAYSGQNAMREEWGRYQNRIFQAPAIVSAVTDMPYAERQAEEIVDRLLPFCAITAQPEASTLPLTAETSEEMVPQSSDSNAGKDNTTQALLPVPRLALPVSGHQLPITNNLRNVPEEKEGKFAWLTLLGFNSQKTWHPGWALVLLSVTIVVLVASLSK